ncbi:hypothetical protein ABS71_19440 [bacterium SCN 62-11]|nr:hypothetical protein [Candidatus Eremiobacteraeota bacterium]ODT57691.1 MAG: hypothetical protein ABS71_19440 [bacterium SCN 62-11]
MRKAFTLLEALASIGLLLLALRFCLMPLVQANRGSSSSLQRLRAMGLAREWIQHDAFAQTLDTQVRTEDGFSIQRQVTNGGARLKSVSIRVEWAEARQTRQVVLETQTFDPRETP